MREAELFGLTWPIVDFKRERCASYGSRVAPV
jgi:hypothetical protein